MSHPLPFFLAYPFPVSGEAGTQQYKEMGMWQSVTLSLPYKFVYLFFQEKLQYRWAVGAGHVSEVKG